MPTLSKYNTRKNIFITSALASDLDYHYAMNKNLVIQKQGESSIVIYYKPLASTYQAHNDICLKFDGGYFLWICGKVAEQLNDSVCLDKVSTAVYALIPKEHVDKENLIEICYD